MEYPTITVIEGPDGQRQYRVEALGYSVTHPQPWQAEAMFQQLAVARGIQLPPDWYREQLGFRSRPA
jgi:hypothetical protein